MVIFLDSLCPLQLVFFSLLKQSPIINPDESKLFCVGDLSLLLQYHIHSNSVWCEVRTSRMQVCDVHIINYTSEEESCLCSQCCVWYYSFDFCFNREENLICARYVSNKLWFLRDESFCVYEPKDTLLYVTQSGNKVVIVWIEIN